MHASAAWELPYRQARATQPIFRLGQRQFLTELASAIRLFIWSQNNDLSRTPSYSDALIQVNRSCPCGAIPMPGRFLRKTKVNKPQHETTCYIS